MKLLSLWEPWATLMSMGVKRIETRSWETSYRGWLAIHASKGGLSLTELRDQCMDPEFFEVLKDFDPFARAFEQSTRNKRWIADAFPRGCIVACARLETCWPTSQIGRAFPEALTPQERAFGNYEAGRWGWITSDLRSLETPIPFKAAQGLIDVPSDVVAEIQRQLKPEAVLA